MPNTIPTDPVSLQPTLDSSDLAALFKLHPKTVRKLLADGELPATKVRGQWRVRSEDAAAFLVGDGRCNAAEYDAHIQAIVDAWPPLRPDQIAALSALFDWQPDQGGDDAA